MSKIVETDGNGHVNINLTIPLLFVTGILLILKFTVIKGMSWWVVFSPIWIPFAIMLVITFLGFITMAIISMLNPGSVKWTWNNNHRK